MNLTDEIVASARRYSERIFEQLEIDGPMCPEAREKIASLMHGAYISGISTVASAQCANDGSEALSPHALVRACDQAARVFNFKERVIL